MHEFPPYKVYAHTFGCRLNQYESDGILQSLLREESFVLAPSMEGTDFLIINTCTVTDQADRKAFAWLKRFSSAHPRVRLVVTGCLAQTDPEKFSEFANIFLLMGNERKTELPKVLQERIDESGRSKNQIYGQNQNQNQNQNQKWMQCKTQVSRNNERLNFGFASVFPTSTVYPHRRTRAYLKIQDGCHKQCSYCKIPQARGRAQSRPMQDILADVEKLEERGVPEIVVTGVNIGWYRDGNSRSRLPQLLEHILQRLSRGRLRISSIEPCDVDEALAQVMQHPRFCPFLHVPLQSGSLRILRGMKRSYTVESFRKRIEVVRRYHPDIFLGTDIIAGFPSESSDDFSETMRFCEEIGFANIHPFSFSPRKGTMASFFGPKIHREQIRQRVQKLQTLRRSLWHRYVEKIKGQTREVIVEKMLSDESEMKTIPRTHGRCMGTSEDFLRVIVNLPSASNPNYQNIADATSIPQVPFGSKIKIRIGQVIPNKKLLIQGLIGNNRETPI